MFLHRVSVLLALVAALCAPPLLSAQGTSSNERDDPKAEVFGGYSLYRTGGKVNSVTVPDVTTGWAGQFIIRTNHWTAIVADIGGHYNSSAAARDYALGVRLQRPWWRFAPFGEALLGVQHFSPKGLPSQNMPTYTGGAGLDIRITPRFSVRPFQLSYVYVNNVYSSNIAAIGQDSHFGGLRAQAGLIYNLGLSSPEGETQVSCGAEPHEVDAGEAVKISVGARGFLRKRTLSYSYSSTGGNITGTRDAASVDTTGVNAGTYTVEAKVTDNGKKKHRQTASCETNFAVKAKLPPTLSISADPVTLLPGESSKIIANGTSPDHRPLSYTCSADGGQLVGSEATYTLATAGVSEAKITVQCTVSDDRSLSASANAAVTVTVPKSKTPPPTRFGTIEFLHDSKRPTRVDNQAKGELDRFADALAATPDAKGIVVGYASAAEKKDSTSPSAAALRSANTKDYLVKDKGIDGARIEPRISDGEGQKVELWMIPAGSTFTAEGTTVVDEKKVKAVPRVALKVKAHKRVKKHKQKGSSISH